MRRIAAVAALVIAIGLSMLGAGCSKPGAEAGEGKATIESTRGRTGPVARQGKHKAADAPKADADAQGR